MVRQGMNAWLPEEGFLDGLLVGLRSNWQGILLREPWNLTQHIGMFTFPLFALFSDPLSSFVYSRTSHCPGFSRLKPAKWDCE